MSLPLEYKGFSTLDLLNLWEKIGEGSAQDTDKNLAVTSGGCPAFFVMKGSWHQREKLWEMPLISVHEFERSDYERYFFCLLFVAIALVSCIASLVYAHWYNKKQK